MKTKSEIYVKIPRKEISFLTKIIEGHDNLGVVSTVCPESGLAVIRITPDTADDIRKVLAGLSFVEEIAEPD